MLHQKVHHRSHGRVLPVFTTTWSVIVRSKATTHTYRSNTVCHQNTSTTNFIPYPHRTPQRTPTPYTNTVHQHRTPTWYHNRTTAISPVVCCKHKCKCKYQTRQDKRQDKRQKIRHETRQPTRQGEETRQDRTRQDKTRQDKTRQDKTRRDKIKTRNDMTRHDTTRQGKTRQDKTRQHKTTQDKAKQVLVVDKEQCLSCPIPNPKP